jgi:hypothetical protein
MMQKIKLYGIKSDKLLHWKIIKQRVKKIKWLEKRKCREKDSMKLQKNSGSGKKNKKKR